MTRNSPISTLIVFLVRYAASLALVPGLARTRCNCARFNYAWAENVNHA